MTITVEIPAEAEAKLRQQAKARGLTLDTNVFVGVIQTFNPALLSISTLNATGVSKLSATVSK